MQKRLAKDGEQQGKASDGFGIRKSISHGGCLLGWGQRLVSIYPSCLRDLLRSLVQHQKYWIYACHILSLSLYLSFSSVILRLCLARSHKSPPIQVHKHLHGRVWDEETASTCSQDVS